MVESRRLYAWLWHALYKTNLLSNVNWGNIAGHRDWLMNSSGAWFPLGHLAICKAGCLLACRHWISATCAYIELQLHNILQPKKLIGSEHPQSDMVMHLLSGWRVTLHGGHGWQAESPPQGMLSLQSSKTLCSIHFKHASHVEMTLVLKFDQSSHQ